MTQKEIKEAIINDPSKIINIKLIKKGESFEFESGNKHIKALSGAGVFLLEYKAGFVILPAGLFMTKLAGKSKKDKGLYDYLESLGVTNKQLDDGANILYDEYLQNSFSLDKEIVEVIKKDSKMFPDEAFGETLDQIVEGIGHKMLEDKEEEDAEEAGDTALEAIKSMAKLLTTLDRDNPLAKQIADSILNYIINELEKKVVDTQSLLDHAISLRTEYGDSTNTSTKNDTTKPGISSNDSAIQDLLNKLNLDKDNKN